jgi:cytochrome c
MRKVILWTSAFVPMFFASAFADGDAALGKGDATLGRRQFAPCTSCHTIEVDGPDKVGPNLHGVVGRKAGSRVDFAYSDAMKNSGITWDEAKLDAFIASPIALVPGTKMGFLGVPKEEVRANIVAYLKEATN